MNQVKLLVFDVDGVLTDGKIFFGKQGEAFKSFHTQDGLGMNIARHIGMKIVWITGRYSDAVVKRADELMIDAVYQGVHDKVSLLKIIAGNFKIQMDHIGYMGDDLNDLPVLRVVGYPAAPNNAVPLVKQAAQYVAEAMGGEGAAREWIDHLLASQYDYSALLEQYFNGLVLQTQ